MSRTVSRDGAIWNPGRNTSLAAWVRSWCQSRFHPSRLRGRATSPAEGSNWNDLRQARETGGWDGDFPSGKRRMIISGYGLARKALARKTAHDHNENAQCGSSKCALEKVKQLEEEETRRNGKHSFTAEGLCQLPLSTSWGSLKVEKRLSQQSWPILIQSESHCSLEGELGAIEPSDGADGRRWSESRSVLAVQLYREEWKENENLEPLPDIIQAYLSQELGDMSSGVRKEALLLPILFS